MGVTRHPSSTRRRTSRLMLTLGAVCIAVGLAGHLLGRFGW